MTPPNDTAATHGDPADSQIFPSPNHTTLSPATRGDPAESFATHSPGQDPAATHGDPALCPILISPHLITNNPVATGGDPTAFDYQFSPALVARVLDQPDCVAAI